MKHAKIIDTVVTQVQPIQYETVIVNKKKVQKPILVEGYIEVDDSVVNGMIQNVDDSFSNPTKTPEQIIAKMIEDGEIIIQAHIQTPIDEYNLANGVKFAHAHTCANYKDEVGYIHQEFCQQAWSFNVATWEAGRLIQIDVLAGTITAPTPEEFIAMLPVFGA